MAFGADRSVAVTLKANVTDYIGKVSAASKATRDLAQDAEKSATKHRASWEKVGTGMALTGAAIGAGVLLAVKSFADFDKEMSNVRAVSGATAGEMKLLSAAALDAGAKTKFSATEAARAQGELAKVGISTADILGGALLGSLNLAAAGNLDLGRAAEISGQAMKIFKLEGRDIGRIADVLAAGANKSAADVEQLAQALQQGGLVAAQTGLTLEDTVGTLSAFADNALLGSDAGTSLKTMLQRLNPQSDEAAALMKDLGLSAFDASGEFIGITQYAGQLQGALKNMSTEQRLATMQTLFGSDAVRAATVLYDLGAQGIAGYVSAVNDQGAAARVAAIQMDNLAGDLERLRGSIETALIQAGSAGNGVLRSLVQTVEAAVNGFGSLPAPLQQGAFWLAALASAGLLAGGAFLTLVPKIAAAKTAMAALGITAQLSRVSVAGVVGFLSGPWGIALGAAAAAVGVFVSSQMKAKQQADDLRGSLDQQTGAITANTREMVAKQLQDAGAFKIARELGVSLQTVTDAALGNTAALESMRAAQDTFRTSAEGAAGAAGRASGAYQQNVGDLGNLTGTTNAAARATGEQAASMDKLLGIVRPVNEVLSGQTAAQREVAEASGAAAGAAGGLAGAQKQLATETRAAKDATDSFAQSLIDAGLVVLSTRAAQRELRQAVADTSAAVKDNGKTLNINTEAGRKNQAALDDVAGSALRLADAVYKETGSESAMRASLVASRASLIATGIRFGLSRSAATQYADSVLRIPPAKSTTITQPGMQAAISNTQTLKQYMDSLRDKTLTITTRNIITTTNVVTGQRSRQPTLGRAEGGPVYGPGTTTSDSVPAWLSTGEYVVKAAAVDKYGTHFFDRLNGMRFATGGVVPPAPAARQAGPAPQVDQSINVTANGPTAADIAHELDVQRRMRDVLHAPLV